MKVGGLVGILIRNKFCIRNFLLQAHFEDMYEITFTLLSDTWLMPPREVGRLLAPPRRKSMWSCCTSEINWIAEWQSLFFGGGGKILNGKLKILYSYCSETLLSSSTRTSQKQPAEHDCAVSTGAYPSRLEISGLMGNHVGLTSIFRFFFQSTTLLFTVSELLSRIFLRGAHSNGFCYVVLHRARRFFHFWFPTGKIAETWNIRLFLRCLDGLAR